MFLRRKNSRKTQEQELSDEVRSIAHQLGELKKDLGEFYEHLHNTQEYCPNGLKKLEDRHVEPRVVVTSDKTLECIKLPPLDYFVCSSVESDDSGGWVVSVVSSDEVHNPGTVTEYEKYEDAVSLSTKITDYYRDYRNHRTNIWA